MPKREQLKTYSKKPVYRPSSQSDLQNIFKSPDVPSPFTSLPLKESEDVSARRDTPQVIKPVKKGNDKPGTSKKDGGKKKKQPSKKMVKDTSPAISKEKSKSELPRQSPVSRNPKAIPKKSGLASRNVLIQQEMDSIDKVRNWMFQKHFDTNKDEDDENEYSSIELLRESQYTSGHEKLEPLFSKDIFSENNFFWKPSFQTPITSKKASQGLKVPLKQSSRTISPSDEMGTLTINSFMGKGSSEGTSSSQPYEIGTLTLNKILENGSSSASSFIQGSNLQQSSLTGTYTLKESQASTNLCPESTAEARSMSRELASRSGRKRKGSADCDFYDVELLQSLSPVKQHPADVVDVPDVSVDTLQLLSTDLHPNTAYSSIGVLPKKRLKYLSSTMKRGVSLGQFTADFPSDLSNINNQPESANEKTPNKPSEFTVPSSPAKLIKTRKDRKGSLLPRNSTVLFQSDFMEFVDVVPQMSTIHSQQISSSSLKDTGTSAEQNSSVSEKASKEKEKEPVFDSSLGRDWKKQENYGGAGPITSTPDFKKGDKPDFQFQIDLSRVSCADTDCSELGFKASTREIDSRECLNLSETFLGNKETVETTSVDVRKVTEPYICSVNIENVKTVQSTLARLDHASSFENIPSKKKKAKVSVGIGVVIKKASHGRDSPRKQDTQNVFTGSRTCTPKLQAKKGSHARVQHTKQKQTSHFPDTECISVEDKESYNFPSLTVEQSFTPNSNTTSKPLSVSQKKVNKKKVTAKSLSEKKSFLMQVDEERKKRENDVHVLCENSTGIQNEGESLQSEGRDGGAQNKNVDGVGKNESSSGAPVSPELMFKVGQHSIKVCSVMLARCLLKPGVKQEAWHSSNFYQPKNMTVKKKQIDSVCLARSTSYS